MFALRYVALAALAIWVGGLILLLLGGAATPDAARLVHRAGVACGGVLLAALVAMKFLGPPPYAFPLRALVTAGMLALTLAATLEAAHGAATALRIVIAAAGLFLLSFYARE